jgi:hypothetical protein
MHVQARIHGAVKLAPIGNNPFNLPGSSRPFHSHFHGHHSPSWLLPPGILATPIQPSSQSISLHQFQHTRLPPLQILTPQCRPLNEMTRWSLASTQFASPQSTIIAPTHPSSLPLATWDLVPRLALMPGMRAIASILALTLVPQASSVTWAGVCAPVYCTHSWGGRDGPVMQWDGLGGARSSLKKSPSPSSGSSRSLTPNASSPPPSSLPSACPPSPRTRIRRCVLPFIIIPMSGLPNAPVFAAIAL